MIFKGIDFFSFDPEFARGKGTVGSVGIWRLLLLSVKRQSSMLVGVKSRYGSRILVRSQVFCERERIASASLFIILGND